jgi:hypothetical protein
MVAKKGAKLREPEARILALRIAASQKGREATTEFIKAQVPKYRDLTEDDLKPSMTRNTEQMWQQIVGNVVSHQKTSTSIFKKGYAVRISKGIRVTDTGVAFLKGKGF